MKKICILIALPFMCFMALSAQITQEQADEIVLEHLSQVSVPYSLFAKEDVQKNMIITTSAGEILELDYSCWVYNVRSGYTAFGNYLIVNESNGNLLEIKPKSESVPDDLEKWRIVDIGCEKIYIAENEFISMCVLPYEVTSSSINMLRIANHTKMDLVYGEVFSLEYFHKNEWMPVSLDGVNWTDIGYILYPGNVTEKQIHLYWLKEYNNNQKGKYRIVRSYRLTPCFPSSNDAAPCLPTNIDEKVITLYVEFIIK